MLYYRLTRPHQLIRSLIYIIQALISFNYGVFMIIVIIDEGIGFLYSTNVEIYFLCIINRNGVII